MNRFADPRVFDIWSTRTCPSLPTGLVQPTSRLTRLLLASHSWSDVAVFTQVAQLPDGRFIAPVHGKWGIAFEWLDGFGPHALSLQRI